MEKRFSIGNRCLEIRVWKALDIRLTSVRKPKKFIGKRGDVKSESTNLRQLSEFGHTVAVWSR